MTLSINLFSKEEDAEFICEAKSDTTYPTLVNAGAFHRAYNKQTNVPRYVVSFSLLNKDNSYLTFNDACSILSKCHNQRQTCRRRSS